MTRVKHPNAIQGATRGKSDGLFVIVEGIENRLCAILMTPMLCVTPSLGQVVIVAWSLKGGGEWSMTQAANIHQAFIF